MPFGYSIEYRESPRAYHLNWTDTEGEQRLRVPSVTTVLGILDKPALFHWSAKITREGVCELDREGKLPNLSGEKSAWALKAALDENNLSHTSKRDTAATRGTSVHDALELWATDGKVPNPQDFPPADRGYVKALASYLADHEPVFLQSEVPVGSFEHKFAGRLDHIIEVDGQPAILDLKTSKDLYREVHIQTAAYAMAASEMQIIPTDPEDTQTFAVCAREDGTYKAIECVGSHEDFLAILGAYNALKTLDKTIKTAQAVAA